MNLINDWREIKVGETIRLRNTYGQELDRDIISADAKFVVYQRHEVEQGSTSKISTKGFIRIYNQMAVPYDPQFSGDWVAAFIDPDFDFDDEEGQIALKI